MVATGTPADHSLTPTPTRCGSQMSPTKKFGEGEKDVRALSRCTCKPHRRNLSVRFKPRRGVQSQSDEPGPSTARGQNSARARNKPGHMGPCQRASPPARVPGPPWVWHGTWLSGLCPARGPRGAVLGPEGRARVPARARPIYRPGMRRPAWHARHAEARLGTRRAARRITAQREDFCPLEARGRESGGAGGATAGFWPVGGHFKHDLPSLAHFKQDLPPFKQNFENIAVGGLF